MNETVIARVRRPGLKVESIPLSEWREYVQSHSRLRLQEERIRIENPQTGQVLECPPQPGNVEFFWNGRWSNAFWWNRDSIRFKIPSACKFDDPKEPFWSMVIELCAHFGGLIRDEFEEDWYDPASGAKVTS
jgi:hypothetical protein